jgi:hypothetical protein
MDDDALDPAALAGELAKRAEAEQDRWSLAGRLALAVAADPEAGLVFDALGFNPGDDGFSFGSWSGSDGDKAKVCAALQRVVNGLAAEGLTVDRPAEPLSVFRPGYMVHGFDPFTPGDDPDRVAAAKRDPLVIEISNAPGEA